MTEYDALFITAPNRAEWKDSYPPLGISYLSAMLKKHGYKVKMVDGAFLTYQEIEQILTEHKTKLVGVSCPTAEQRMSAVEVIKIAKKVNPASTVILGGIHYSIFPEFAFKLSPVDIVVLGEGELTVVELADYIIKGKKRLSEINGIVYQSKGKLITTPPRQFIDNLDILPIPNYEGFDLTQYFQHILYKKSVERTRNMKPGRIMVSRGCPFSCLFCSTCNYWGRRIRYRSVDKIIEEVKYLQKEFGTEWIMFTDDNFTFNKERIIAFCKEIIKQDIVITWAADSRIRGINKETLKWMKKAGCYAVLYGVESGSPKILKNIRKAQTIEEIDRVFKWTREAGIQPMGFLMIGNPGETFYTIYETYKLWKKIAKPEEGIGANLTWVFPNCGLYTLAKEKGVIEGDEYWLTENPIPIYTGDHSIFMLNVLKFFLYFLWFQHVMIRAKFKIKVRYLKAAWVWGRDIAKYMVANKELKVQM